MEPLKIDGSYGEGGGQILRSAITLSCITKKPIEIDNIRKNRKIPGLRAQHLTSIKILARICNARVKGLEIGSSKIKFFPSEVQDSDLSENVGTAGSISLILQVLIPVVSLSRRKMRLSIIGGTDVSWSPTINYTKYVLAEAYSRMGIKFSIKVKKRGYYPKGGGKVDVEIFPLETIRHTLLLKRTTQLAKLFCSSSNVSSQKIENEIKKAVELLERKNFSVTVENKIDPALNEGGSMLIFSNDSNSIIGIDSLFDNRINDKGRIMAKKFLQSDLGVDEHLADMLVVPASLINKKSVFSVKNITKHLETNLYVTSKITNAKYGIGKLSNGYEIRIVGDSKTCIQ